MTITSAIPAGAEPPDLDVCSVCGQVAEIASRQLHDGHAFRRCAGCLDPAHEGRTETACPGCRGAR